MTTIIVSGTRHATLDHLAEVRARLSQWRAAGQVTLVHGDADGVDKLSSIVGRSWGWEVIPVPAEWQKCDHTVPVQLGGCPPQHHTKVRGNWFYCPLAGPRRNQRMLLDFDADIGVCFPIAHRGLRSGTADFMERAIRAALPLQVYPLTVEAPGQYPDLFTPAGAGEHRSQNHTTKETR